MQTIFTTLAAIRQHSPCEDGWEKLLKHLGKTRPDDEPLKFSTILESNGLDDALWCLRSLPEEHHPHARLMACDFAENVLYIFEKQRPEDDRPRKAIETSRRFANGEASQEELDAAGDAAGDAARAAWDAALDAAGDAPRAARAAWTAAGDAPRAAWTAARAAGDAAWDAGDAERKIQAALLIEYFG